MPTVTVHATLPAEMLQSFLQHLRDFEGDRKEVMLFIGVDAREMSAADCMTMLQEITPRFAHLWLFPTPKEESPRHDGDT